MADVSRRIVASDGKFRIVRMEAGERVDHALEKRDGEDAMGVERWRDCNVGVGESLSRQLRDWIIEHALKCDRMEVS